MNIITNKEIDTGLCNPAQDAVEAHKVIGSMDARAGQNSNKIKPVKTYNLTAEQIHEALMSSNKYRYNSCLFLEDEEAQEYHSKIIQEALEAAV